MASQAHDAFDLKKYVNTPICLSLQCHNQTISIRFSDDMEFAFLNMLLDI